MSFTDTSRDSGHWCSRQDCVDCYRDLASMLRDKEDPLNRQITIATDEAEAVLRARWPDEWPFSSPTPAVRRAVAAISTYRVVSSLPVTGGDIEALSDGAEHGWEFLADMAAGRARVDMTGEERKVEQVRVQTPEFPAGKFGFSKELGG